MKPLTLIRIFKQFVKAWLVTSIFIASGMIFGYKGYNLGGVKLDELLAGWQWFLMLTAGMAACYIYYSLRMKK